MAGYLGTKAVFLSTTAGSVTGDMSVGGNVVLGDNSKAIFGAGSDLQIYHDGSNSYVSDQGAGNLILRGANLQIDAGSVGNARFITANATDKDVKLYHTDSVKLATTATGVDVTGTVTADGLETIGATVNTSPLRLQSLDTSVNLGESIGDIEFYSNDSSGGGTGVQAKISAIADNSFGTSYALNFLTGASASPLQRLNIAYNGDISFYEDTGTTPKFFWDASAESLTVNSTVKVEGGTTNGFLQASGSSFQLGASTASNLIAYTNNAERMRITDGGFVGVGTASPARPFSAVATGNTTSVFERTDGTYVLEMKGSGTTMAAALGMATNDMVVATGGSERVRIDSSGNLLVGVTSVLDVGANTNVGTSFTPGIIQSSNNNSSTLRLQRTGTDGYIQTFYKDTTFVGSIYTTGSSTSYNTSSDYRLKENVTPLDGAADRLAQIPVHRFNFIADPDTTVDGFLAHEVQAIVPEAVTGEKDAVDADGNPEYQGIDQSKLVPLLTAALQEALADIAKLKAEVAALKEI